MLISFRYSLILCLFLNKSFLLPSGLFVLSLRTNSVFFVHFLSHPCVPNFHSNSSSSILLPYIILLRVHVINVTTISSQILNTKITRNNDCEM
jgi:hypothetical protein